jgi:transcriptional regulator with XRE-family HTH domain
MEEAGLKLKRVRERLGLRYRDVELLSQKIAERRRNPEFTVALSRLADIENRGTVPSLYKLYSLCAIYRVRVEEVLSWYGVRVSDLPSDSASVQHDRTHTLETEPAPEPAPGATLRVPLGLDPGFDWRQTTFISRLIARWGLLPVSVLQGFDPDKRRYGYIGLDDYFMYPMIPPGSLVLIDESKHKIAEGWGSEHERPVYFLEHRNGWSCAWCSIEGDHLILQPHPASRCGVRILPYPSGVEIVGQVVGAAIRLDMPPPRPVRS